MKKIRKEILIILILFFIIFTLFYFFRINKSLTKVQTLNKKFQTKTKIGVIFGYGGLGDKSFNDMQYNGVIKAKNMFNIDITYYAPKDKNDIINKINQFVGEGMKYIIVGEGYDGLEVIKELAQIYKNIHFILLDNKFDKYLNNMSSVLFKQNEVSFLVGALSSLVSKKKSILFFGGMNLDVIDDFYVGFEQGAKYVVSDIKINKVYFSDYIESEKVWNSPKEAFEVIDNLYNKMKFDIVYAVAAGTNLGVFNACKKNNIFSIGV
ncbi:MAG: BMP family ABC transporter substrate-binding protein, partial [Spirochaetes bacterium]|nr:BMP family ABC transporter substrate-binding protein [Spirochaetota bacterium]